MIYITLDHSRGDNNCQKNRLDYEYLQEDKANNSELTENKKKD